MQIPRIAPLLVAALIAHTARAEILLPGASLAVKNPPSMATCVDETQLGARIRTQLSRRVARETTLSSLQLKVTIRRTLTTLVGDLRMTGRAGGTRQIEAARCEGLTEALAVTIAMILDEDAEESRTKAATNVASASAGQAEAEVPPAAVPATQPVAAKPADTQITVPETPPEVGSGGFRLGRDHELRALLGGGYGSSKSWMVELGAEYAYRDWAMKLGAYLQPTYDMALGAGELELMSIGGVAAGCRQIGSRWRFVPCARVTLGMESVKGFGFDRSSPQRLLVGSLGPTVGVETGSRWVAGLELIGQVPMWRDEYVVENPRETAKAPLFVVWLVARVALSSRPPAAAGR